ncbi:MAG: hypothetical protein INQ03_25615 [Candidatus Heimdallarchaeota archaeon]|nr:hypothetical protein [Candidatus Heimdallarchaeota archaeon]
MKRKVIILLLFLTISSNLFPTVTVSSIPGNAFNPTYVSEFGSWGTEEGQMQNPHSIAVNSEYIYIVDTYNRRIQIFDHSFNFLSIFGSSGTGNGQFSGPQGIFANESHVLVIDEDLSRVQIFTSNGTYVAQFGTVGSGNDQFYYPKGIFMNDTNIFIADSGNERIQIFDKKWNYVDTIEGWPIFHDLGNSNFPTNVYVDDTYIWISEFFNHRIVIYNLAGTYIGEIANQGSNNDVLGNPFGITGDNHYIFITEDLNGRVSIIEKSSLTIIGRFGSNGVNPGQFTSPQGITQNGTHIFITEYHGHVHIYSYNAVPINLEAYKGQDFITLSFYVQPHAFDITLYRIYRGLSGESLAFLAETTNTVYIDDNIDNQQFYYAVSTVNQFGESPLSEAKGVKVEDPVITTITEEITITETTIKTDIVSNIETITKNYTTTEFSHPNTTIISTIVESSVFTEIYSSFIISNQTLISSILAQNEGLPIFTPTVLLTSFAVIVYFRRKN